MRINSNNAGFSLLEIMTVIAIIALVMGIVVRNLPAQLAEEKLVSVVKDIKLSIKDAKAQSILRGEELIFRVDLINNLVTVEKLPETDITLFNYDEKDARRDYFRHNKGEVLSEWSIDESITLAGVYLGEDTYENEVALILFSPDGTSESFRLKFIVTDTDNELVLELRGLFGDIQEIPAEDFEKEWDDVDTDVNPPLVEYDEFFEDGLPVAPPAESKAESSGR